MTDSITIMGNVGTDPQRTVTKDGLTVTEFRLGSTRRRRDAATGEWVDSGTSWFRVSCFRGLAENVFQSVRRGEGVIVTGDLRVRQWENDRGRGTDVEIRADAVGHDMRWGSSTLTRQPTGVPSETPVAEAPAQSWAPESAAPTPF